MKYTFLKMSLFVAALISMTACEKVIDIELDAANSQYVVIGTIENIGSPCTVKINKSVGFSDPNNYPTVAGAIVTLTDSEGNTETLKETKSGVYTGSKILGKANMTYDLKITHNGNTFTSTSKMPEKSDILGVKFVPRPLPGGGEAFGVLPLYQDKANVANFYRLRQIINGEEDKTIVVYNDLITDGKLNARPIFSQVSAEKGDTVKVILNDIDAGMYDYYFSLQSSTGGASSGGPGGGGGAPSNPIAKIQGGALGYFSAQTRSEKTVIVE